MPLVSFDTPWKHQKNSGFQKETADMKWVNVNSGLQPKNLRLFTTGFVGRLLSTNQHWKQSDELLNLFKIDIKNTEVRTAYIILVS